MIIRSVRSEKFTVISNSVIDDSDLDWRDLGLLVYLLSKPDNWEISVEHLCRQRKLGRDGLYASLNVLINVGYVVRNKLSNGKINWTIYDDKKPDRENPEKAANSLIGKIPNRENPDRENPTLINTNNKQRLITDITNTDKENKKKIPVALSLDMFNEFYSAYPKKVDKPAAQRAWKKLNPSDQLKAEIISNVEMRKSCDRKWVEGFIANPATFLNGRRWEDEIQLSTINNSKQTGEKRYANGMTFMEKVNDMSDFEGLIN